MIDGRGIKAGFAEVLIVIAVIRNATAGSAHREGGADNRGQADIFEGGHTFVHGVGDCGARVFDVQAVHRFTEQLTVFGHFDGFALCADQLNVEFLKNAHVIKSKRGVQARLTAHCGQQCVGALFLDDLGNNLWGDRLDVGCIGKAGVCHDGGRVRVNQDNPVTFFAQRLTGLGARVVELTSLANHNRPRSDDHD